MITCLAFVDRKAEKEWKLENKKLLVGDKTMGYNYKKFPLTIYATAILAAIIPLLFYYLKKIYWMTLVSNLGTTKKESDFILLLIFLLSLGTIIIDIIWILYAIYGRLKNKRVKTYITVFLLTISSVILYTLLYSVLGSMALSRSMH